MSRHCCICGKKITKSDKTTKRELMNSLTKSNFKAIVHEKCYIKLVEEASKKASNNQNPKLRSPYLNHMALLSAMIH